MTLDSKALEPCPLCKSDVSMEDPHEVMHVYEGDGGVIIRENGNISMFGVRSPEVMAAFDAATALPVEMSVLISRLRKVEPEGGDDGTTRYYRNPDGPGAADIIIHQSARIAALEAERQENFQRVVDVSEALIDAASALEKLADTRMRVSGVARVVAHEAAEAARAALSRRATGGE